MAKCHGNVSFEEIYTESSRGIFDGFWLLSGILK